MNEVNRSNFVVDLGYNDTRKKLKLYAILNTTAIEEKWQLLGNGRCKRYFRFGYVDSVIDPEFKGESGYYYWTADSMRSNDYKNITFEEAIGLLVSIDKNIEKRFYLDGRECKINMHTTQIGCRKVLNSDLSALQILMRTNDIDMVTVHVGSEDVRIRYSELYRLNQIIKKKG